jgi:hypothetical protein
MVMAPRSPERVCAGLTACLALLTMMAGSPATADATADATECPASTHTLLRIERQSSPLEIDHALGVADIARIAKRPAEAGFAASHVLGIFVSSLRYSISLSDEQAQIGPQAICATPRELVLRIGYADRTIHLANQIRDDGCLSDLVLDHERKHVVADERALQRFVDYFRSDFQLALVELRVSAAPTPEAARANLTASVTAMVDQATPSLATLRDQASAAVDTTDEIVRLTKGCNARGPKLVRQAMQAF